MKKSSKVIIVILVLVFLAGCGVGAYFLFRNKSANDGGDSGTQEEATSRYDGMYYYYMSGTVYKSEYIKLKGDKWASADGDGGTYKVDGLNITLYKSVMGDNEVILSGTIYDGIITVKRDIAGISMNIYYCQEGKAPSNV